MLYVVKQITWMANYREMFSTHQYFSLDEKISLLNMPKRKRYLTFIGVFFILVVEAVLVKLTGKRTSMEEVSCVEGKRDLLKCIVLILIVF